MWIAVPPGATADSPHLRALQAEALAVGKVCVVSAVIVDPAGRAFVQQRSANRRLLPLCWDIAGGHVEPGETLFEALVREVHEETGWRLLRLVDLIGVVDWEAAEDGVVQVFREFSFTAEVTGDLTAPRLEETKVTEFRWVAPSDLELLREHRAATDVVLFELVERGLQLASNRA